ncbi:MAG TPA: M55 family metallopeptidase [Candidatus Micrarchaeia archaeon]|nr:M55 family metallopeptidase [Candidatus Micrarchaeia archaeon]
MRILISVDMEGISGVAAWDDVRPGTPGYERFRRQMTLEANAAVAGAFAAGAASVVVNDAHDGMHNLLYESLDGRAELISGTMKPLDMVEGGTGADAAVFIGYHAMAGAEGGVLAHTMSGSIANWYLGGVAVGETQINAAILGQLGVPVVLVSGDAQLAQEVERTLPQARRVVVKWGTDEETARSRPRDEVLRCLAEEVQQAVAGAAAVEPIRVPGPVTIAIEFVRPAHATAASLCPQIRRAGGRRVEITAADILEAYRLSWVASILAHSVGA